MLIAQETYKYFGLYAFIIAWVGMLSTVFTQGRDKSKSISLHAATNKKTIYLLAVLSPLTMTMFILFSVKWMAPTFHLHIAFSALSVVSNIGYILAAWVPATTVEKTKIHNWLAYGATLLLMPISLILAASPYVALTPRIINSLSLIVMLAIFLVMYFRQAAKNYHLYYQIGYFLAFDIGLLAAAYITI